MHIKVSQEAEFLVFPFLIINVSDISLAILDEDKQTVRIKRSLEDKDEEVFLEGQNALDFWYWFQQEF